MSARSRKSINSAADLDLSLTGSQISTLSSSRRPNSARGAASPSTGKRPNSASLVRGKSPVTAQNATAHVNGYNVTGSNIGTGARKKHSRASSSNAALSHRSDASNISQQSTPKTKKSARDDFLALFESNSQPKMNRPRGAGQTQKTSASKPMKATWDALSPKGQGVSLSARSNSTLASERGDGPGARSHTASYTMSHSIFQPVSARSTSTIDTVDDRFSDLENMLHKEPTAKSRTPRRSSSDMDQPGTQSTFRKSLSTEGFLSNFASNSHSEERVLNSQRPNSPRKSQNLNSITNNMTSHAMTPGAKTSLSNIENSYQNIKPKTPVNQVKRLSPPSSSVGRNVAENYIKTVNMSACKIQRWYRRHFKRRRAGEAAVKRLLDQKRQEKTEELKLDLNPQDYEQQSVDERKKVREEKARKARQQAIQDLKSKREEKRLEVKKKAEEEIQFLQATGKISKKPANSSTNVKKKVQSKTQAKNQVLADAWEAESDSTPAPPSQRPGTASSVGRKVDDIFQESMSYSHSNRTPRNRNEAVASEGSSEEEEVGGARRRGHVEAATEEAAPPTPSQAATSTLNDLMETLKLLEEEEKFPMPRNEKSAWMDEGDKQHTDSECASYLSADKLEKFNHPSKENIKKPTAINTMLSEDKLRSIMSFLDEVDTTERMDDLDTEINTINDNLEKPVPLVPSNDELEEMQKAAAATAEVTNHVLAQRLELEERNRSVSMLQKALNQQRELTVRHAKETEKEMKGRLHLQKDEYEETIKRHLSFIDQLIDDKKLLSEKCEHLVRELKTMDKKYSDKIRAVEEKHNVDMQKVKDVQAAAEKLRREKWIDEKTKKIKEMTVKGLEPEIQRLIAKHKSEVKKLKSIHEAELLESDERAGQRYIKLTEELRDQLAQEKEAACSRERELARQTYEKQLQQEEEAYQQQRRRLYQEVQDEKERISKQAQRQRGELDKLQRQLEDNHSSSSSALKDEYEKAREEQERRHTAEMRSLREQLQVEKEAWEENYKKKHETWLLQRERELKEQVRRDRDKEIDLVIQRLEEDNITSKDECERLAENKIKRIRDKYETEMEELERSERQAMEKYNEMKGRLAEAEGEQQRMKVVIKQKEQEIDDVKQLSEKLHKERDYVSDIIRQEFADRLVATEEENKRLKNDMSELKARHRLELERSKTEVEVIIKAKEDEMEEVHKRVKQAILKKEEVVTQLRQQYQAAVKRADHLEGLLEQQRKQLLKLSK